MLTGPGHVDGECDPLDRSYGGHVYRWRSENGGMKLDQMKPLKELEVENGRLRKGVSDLTLGKLILK